jgi:hypothetical protein
MATSDAAAFHAIERLCDQTQVNKVELCKLTTGKWCVTIELIDEERSELETNSCDTAADAVVFAEELFDEWRRERG